MFINNEDNRFVPLCVRLLKTEIEEDDMDSFVFSFQYISNMCFNMTEKKMYTVVYKEDKSTFLIAPKCIIEREYMESGSNFIEGFKYVLLERDLPIEEDEIDMNILEYDGPIEIPEDAILYKNMKDIDIGKGEKNQIDMEISYMNIDISHNHTKNKNLKQSEVNSMINSSEILKAMNDHEKVMRNVIKKLITCINKEKRCNTYNNIIKLGSIIFNCSKRLDDIWLSLVKEEWREECINLWKSWGEDKSPYNYGFNTLINMCIYDDKNKTNEILQNSVPLFVKKSIKRDSGKHEIAMLLKLIACDKYVCSNPKKDIWWKFNKTYWEKLEKGPVDVRYDLVYKIRPLYKKEAAYLAAQREKSANCSNLIKNRYDLMINECNKIHKLLGDSSYKNSILKEAADIFYIYKFEDKLNKQTHIVPFKDYVYNSKTHQKEEGNMYHYCNKYLDYNYPEYDENSEDVKWWYDNYLNIAFPPDYYIYNGQKVYDKYGELVKVPIGEDVYKYSESYMRKNGLIKKDADGTEIYNNEKIGVIDKDCKPIYELRDYYMKVWSTPLDRGCDLKIFPIIHGPTNNGKSVIEFLMTKLWSKTFVTVSNSLLLAKEPIKPGAANPDVVALKDTRIGIAHEPPHNSTINDAFIKLLVNGGMDPIRARDLFQKSDEICEFYITGLYMMICNVIPKSNASDKAIKERFKIWPASTTWDDNPPKSELDQKLQRHYKRDPRFLEKVNKKYPAFMWILMQYFKKFKQFGLKEPYIVTKQTNEYLTANDPVGKFMVEKMEKMSCFNEDGTKKTKEQMIKDMGKYKIPVGILCQTFTKWFVEEFKNDKDKLKDINKQYIIGVMKNRRIPYKKLHFLGYRLKN